MIFRKGELEAWGSNGQKNYREVHWSKIRKTGYESQCSGTTKTWEWWQKKKNHTETRVHWAYYTATKFIQPLSFNLNLLVVFGKQLLNGWSHKTQMRGLKTIEEVHALSGDKYGIRWDYQTRGIQTIEQVHVRPGEDGDWINRLEVYLK